jgi:hypothetical protein
MSSKVIGNFNLSVWDFYPFSIEIMHRGASFRLSHTELLDLQRVVEDAMHLAEKKLGPVDREEVRRGIEALKVLADAAEVEIQRLSARATDAFATGFDRAGRDFSEGAQRTAHALFQARQAIKAATKEEGR